MKLFTKIALGISGFFFCVAAFCLIAAVMMGVTFADVKTMIEDGKFSFGPEDGFHIQLWGDNGLNINLGNNPDEEYTEREIPHDCTKIYLELAMGKIDVYYDDVEYVQIQQKNVPGFSLTASESEQSLYIKGDLSVINTSGVELTVILPRGVNLEEVQMDTGASQVTIRDLIIDKFDFTVGAGQANISDVSASECVIEVGAGEAIVENLSVKELDVDAGVGKVDIEIAGAEIDYNYDVECGIGAVTVGNRSFGGMGAAQRITNNGAKHHMDIACGVGEITMRFACDVTDGTCDESSHNHN